MEAFKPNAQELEQIRSKMERSRLHRLRAVTAHLVTRLSAHDVGTAQAIVLLGACARDNAEPAQIADNAFIPRQTMTAILDKLEAGGLAFRADHPSDRRRKVVRLTASGFAKAKEIWDDLDKFEDDLMSVLSPHERRQLDLIMAKLGERLKEDVEGANGRIR